MTNRTRTWCFTWHLSLMLSLPNQSNTNFEKMATIFIGNLLYILDPSNVSYRILERIRELILEPNLTDPSWIVKLKLIHNGWIFIRKNVRAITNFIRTRLSKTTKQVSIRSLCSSFVNFEKVFTIVWIKLTSKD